MMCEILILSLKSLSDKKQMILLIVFIIVLHSMTFSIDLHIVSEPFRSPADTFIQINFRFKVQHSICLFH